MNPAGPFLSAVCIAALDLGAQHDAPLAPATPPLTVASGTVALRARPGGCEAEGPAWLATFTAAGTWFVPALGGGAPRTLPLRLSLAAAGRATALRAQEQVAPTIAGERVEYPRGVLTERFTPHAEGLELSVLVGAPLPGAGDLVVRYRLDTALRAEASADGGMRFLLPEGGGVTVGGVTGIDANGARVTGALRCDGDHLDLVLPAAFVDEARYPLLVDPLLGSEIPVSSGSIDTEPDAAYDATTDRWLVVWRRTFSQNETAIRGQMLSGAGALVGSVIDLTPLGLACRTPSAGNVAIRDQFWVAWAQSTSPFGPFTVVGRRVAADGTLSAQAMALSGNVAANHDEPTVASENGVDDEAVVVWREQGTGIRGAKVRLPATGQPVFTGSAMVSGPYPTARAPALSRSAPSGVGYVVAWAVGGTSDTVVARAIDRNLAFRGNELTVTTAPTGVTFDHVAIDGDATRFLLAFDRTESVVALARDVVARALQWNGTNLVLDGPVCAIDIAVGVDAHHPTVAFLASKYAIAWTEATGSADTEVQGVDLMLDCTPCGGPWSLEATAGMQAQPALATERAGSGLGYEGLLVATRAPQALPFRGAIVARAVAAFGGGPVANVGGGCGTAGTIGTSGGPFALGNRDFLFYVRGAPPGAIAFADLGFPGATLTCAGCTFVQGIVFELRPLVSGYAEFPLPLACDPNFIGLTIAAQWVLFATPSSPCPAAAGLAGTDRLHCTVDA